MSQPEDIGQRTAWALFLLAAVVLIKGYQFPHANHWMEVPALMHSLDPAAFAGDFYATQMGGFSPRTYYFWVVEGLLHLGLSVPDAYFAIFLPCCLSFLLGALAIGRLFGNALVPGMLLFLLLTVDNGTLGHVGLLAHTGEERPSLVPFVVALAFVIWGLHACFQRRWVLGYGLFGIGALFQILVGFLPGLLFAPIVAYDAWNARQPTRVILPALLLGAGVGAVFVPMALTGTTGTGRLDDSEFVYLYAVVRHPHHLLPSSWGGLRWLNFGGHCLGGLLLIAAATRLEIRRRLELAFLVVFTLLLLAVQYVGTELIPSALVTKLQLSRATPFSQFATLIGAALVGDRMLRGRRQIPGAVLLLLCLWLPRGGLALPILGVSVWLDCSADRPASRSMRLGLEAATLLVLLWQHVDLPWQHPLQDALVLLALALACNLPWILGNSPVPWVSGRVAPVALALLAGLVATGSAASLWPHSDLNRRVNLNEVPDSDEVRLARRFAQRAPHGATVLVPPHLGHFKYHAQRAVVVDFKNFPYTDAGIVGWRDRMSAVFGEPMSPRTSWRGNMLRLWARRHPSKLLRVAREHGAEFLLTHDDWHSNVPARRFDSEGAWVLYRIGS